MAVSLLDSLTRLVSPALVSKLSAQTGESTSNLSTGLAAAIPAVFSQIVGRTGDPEFMGSLFALASDPANDSSMRQRIPFDGKINPFGGEQRNWHVAGGFADAHVIDRISASPQLDVHFANGPGVKRVAIQCAVDVVAQEPGQDGTADAQKDSEHSQR